MKPHAAPPLPVPWGEQHPLGVTLSRWGEASRALTISPLPMPVFHPDSSFHPNSFLCPHSSFCASPCLCNGTTVRMNEWVQQAGCLGGFGCFPGAKLLVKVTCLIIITSPGGYLTCMEDMSWRHHTAYQHPSPRQTTFVCHWAAGRLGWRMARAKYWGALQVSFTGAYHVFLAVSEPSQSSAPSSAHSPPGRAAGRSSAGSWAAGRCWGEESPGNLHKKLGLSQGALMNCSPKLQLRSA